MFFHVFLRLDFGIDFGHIFDGNSHQNDLQNRSPGRPVRPKRLPASTGNISGEHPGADLFSGIEFSICFLVPFRRPFGQCWSLLAPFWPLLAPCWALLAPFWEHFGRSWLIFVDFGRILDDFSEGFQRFCTYFLDTWLYNKKLESISAGTFFQTLFGRKPTNEHTHVPQSNKPINRPGGMRARALNKKTET